MVKSLFLNRNSRQHHVLASSQWQVLGFCSLCTFMVLCLVLFMGVHEVGSGIIPTSDIAWDFGLGALWAMLGHIFLFFFPIGGQDREWLQATWVLKVIIIFAVAPFYESHYAGLDAFSYLRHAQESSNLTFSLGDGTSNISYIIDKLDVFTGGSYHALKVVFSLAGLSGCFLFYRGACFLKGKIKSDFAYCLLMFFPSTLFWTTIVGKDPLIVLGLGMYFYASCHLIRLGSAWHVVTLLLGVLITAAVRPWMPFILAIPTGIYIFDAFRVTRPFIVRTIFASTAVIAAGLLLMKKFAVFSEKHLISMVQTYSQTFALGGSRQAYGPFVSIDDIVAFLPVGAFSTVFRPLPGEIQNAFGIAAGMENSILILVLALGVIFFRFPRGDFKVFLWFVTMIMAWTLPYSFVSPFNLGTGFRFRLQILPFVLAFAYYATSLGEPSRREFWRDSGGGNA